MMAFESIWNTGVKSIMQFKNLTALCILSLVILAGSVQARALKEVEAGNSAVVMGACHKNFCRNRVMKLVSWRKRFTVCRPAYVLLLNGFTPRLNQLDYYNGRIQSSL